MEKILEFLYLLIVCQADLFSFNTDPGNRVSIIKLSICFFSLHCFLLRYCRGTLWPIVLANIVAHSASCGALTLKEPMSEPMKSRTLHILRVKKASDPNTVM